MPTISETIDIINTTIALNNNGTKIPLLLWGKHGVGKTTIVHEIAKNNKMNCVILNLANQTPEDLLGQIDGKGGYHTPNWMTIDDKPTVYFLDEINRAPKYVLQCMFNFINEGRIHTHKIKDTDIVIAAANPDNVEYDVTTFDDAAFTSRFAHIKVIPTKDEFIAYLNKNTKNLIIQESLANSTNLYNNNDFKLSFTILPDNRNLMRIAQIFDNLTKHEIESIGVNIVIGLVGYDAASVILQTWRNNEKLNFEDIRKLDKYPFKNTDLDKINIVNTSFFKFISELNMDKISKSDKKDIMKYINFVPKDMKIAILKNISQNIVKGRLDFLSESEIGEFYELINSTK